MLRFLDSVYNLQLFDFEANTTIKLIEVLFSLTTMTWNYGKIDFVSTLNPT